MQNTFKIKEALSFAWKKMLENFWFLVLLTLGFMVVAGLLDKSGSTRSLDVLSQLLGLILSYFAMFTFVRLGLKIYKGHKPTWNDVIEFDLGLFGMYVFGAIIFTISYIVGFVLLIIPGIIVLVRFGFFAFAIIDNKLMPIKAIKKSLEMTRGQFWHLLGFGFVLGLINLLGALALGIGMLITAPLSIIATAYVYEKLKVTEKSA